MPFERGHKKTGGIKKGQKTEKVQQWDRLGKNLVSGESLERAQKLLNKSDDRTFIYLYLRLLKFFKPELARTENTNFDFSYGDFDQTDIDLFIARKITFQELLQKKKHQP